MNDLIIYRICLVDFCFIYSSSPQDIRPTAWVIFIIWISRRIPNQSRNYINPWSGVQVGMIYETKVEECCVLGRILTWTAPRPADSVLVPWRSCHLASDTPMTTATSRWCAVMTTAIRIDDNRDKDDEHSYDDKHCIFFFVKLFQIIVNHDEHSQLLFVIQG